MQKTMSYVGLVLAIIGGLAYAVDTINDGSKVALIGWLCLTVTGVGMWQWGRTHAPGATSKPVLTSAGITAFKVGLLVAIDGVLVSVQAIRSLVDTTMTAWAKSEATFEDKMKAVIADVQSPSLPVEAKSNA